MKFIIQSSIADLKTQDKSLFVVQSLSNELSLCLNDKFYGTDIEKFIINLIFFRTTEGYENWYKERKPKYIDYKLQKSLVTKEEYEIKKEYSYDIKFDYELYDEFVESTDEQSKKILAREVLKSFVHLDKLPKKVKDFDKDKFKTDIENFFKEKNVI